MTSGLFSLEGRVALITGGSRGIGRMIAQGFIAQGARVYISARKAEQCDSTAQELSAGGDTCVSLPGDVSTVEGCRALAAGFGEHEGQLDILVNNAGAIWMAAFDDYPEKGWDKIVNLNLKTPIFLTQALAPLLRKAVESRGNAKVINVASIDGITVNPIETYAYQASKAGLIHLTRQMAGRLIADNIIVSAICPGAFASDINTIARDHGEAVAKHIPAKRIGKPGDMAGAAIYLASEAGDYVVGDHILYEIVHDSLIVVRTGPDEIRAYVNACLHRGTLLRTEGGCAKQFRCPFHGWTWNLDGKLKVVPGEWDFPHIDKTKLSLPEARVATWGGFVFVNFDADCEPLESYLENLPEHFQAFALEDRYKAAHIGKVMPCNWKLCMEAFVEAYHVPVAHSQVLAYYGDSNTQYDVWPGVHHVSRMISVQGVPSPSLKGVPPERTVEEMRRDVPFFGGKPIEVAEGETARQKLAERAREKISRSIGRDISDISDTESMDLIEYMLFPNMVPWGGQVLPLTYRFRPNGDDPETSIMEIMFLFKKGADGRHPEPAKLRMLGPDENWGDAPEMGSAGFIVDQDVDNLMRIQKGLRATKKPGVTLARYQESRIRHFHETLDAYMER